MATAMTPARHYVGLCGLAGLIFAVLTSALVLFLEGFVTTSWSAAGDAHEGLWQICNSGGYPASSQAWLISAQVFATLGLVGLLISFGLAVIYMTGNRASKNVTIVSLAAVSIISGIFMCVSIGVYGAYKKSEAHLSWSYYVTLISAVLCLVGGIMSIVQLRRANVRL